MLGWLIHFLSTYRQLVGFGVIVFGPGLLARAQRLIRNGNQPRAPLTSAVWAILIAHALYTLWALVLPPYDVFVSHGLKIRTPSDVLRPIVLRAAGVPFYDFEANPDSYPLLDLLLTRLGNLDGRYQYARWGHDVFMRCAWCKSKGDMALAALPSIVTPYVVEAVVIGLMGWKWVAGQSARERADRFRPVVGWVLGALIAGDFGVRWTWDVRARLDGDCDHLAPTLYTIRTVVLFLVTVAYIYMPIPQDARAAEIALVRSLDNAFKTQRITSLARAAIARSPAMSRLSNERREARARAEDRARTETTVVAAAQAAGLFEGNDHARVPRDNSRRWLVSEWKRLVKLPGDGH